MLAHSAAASVVPTTRYITIPAQGGLYFYLDASAPPSYPGSGNVWYDLMENFSPSTVRSAVPFTKDGQASYFELPGSDAGVDYYDRAIISEANNMPAFTEGHLSAWVYLNSFGVLSNRFMFNYRNGSADFSFFFAPDTDLLASVNPTSGPNASAEVNLPPAGDYLNQWVYLSITWNGNDSGDTTLKIHRNGVEVASDVNGGTASINAGTNRNIGIGGEVRDEVPPGIEMEDVLDGRIALMHFHTEALSTAQIQSNFNNLKSRFGL